MNCCSNCVDEQTNANVWSHTHASVLAATSSQESNSWVNDSIFWWNLLYAYLPSTNRSGGFSASSAWIMAFAALTGSPGCLPSIVLRNCRNWPTVGWYSSIWCVARKARSPSKNPPVNNTVRWIGAWKVLRLVKKYDLSLEIYRWEFCRVGYANPPLFSHLEGN